MKTILDKIIGKPITGVWGSEDTDGTGKFVLRTTNFTMEGIIDYNDIVKRNVTSKEIDSKYLKYGDIIIEKSGGSEKQPVGRVVYFEGAEKTFLFNNFTGVLRIGEKEKWHSKYIFYALYYNYLQGGTRFYQNKTTGLHNLKLAEYIQAFQIEKKEFFEQERMVKVLDKLRKIIALQKEQLKKLDEFIKSLFIEMFGDLEKNSKNWDEQFWQDIFYTKTGKLDSNAMVIGGKFPFFTCAKEQYWIDNYDFDCEALLLAGNNAAGVYDVKHYKGKFNAYQRTYIITLKNNDWKYEVFKYQLENKLFYLKEQSKGSNTRYLTMTILNKLKFYIFPVPLQNQFAERVTQIDKSKFEIKQSLEKLEILYKSLMQEYFG